MPVSPWGLVYRSNLVTYDITTDWGIPTRKVPTSLLSLGNIIERMYKFGTIYSDSLYGRSNI